MGPGVSGPSRLSVDFDFTYQTTLFIVSGKKRTRGKYGDPPSFVLEGVDLRFMGGVSGLPRPSVDPENVEVSPEGTR